MIDLAVAAALFASLTFAGSASASKRTLTFYANGEPVPVGSESDNHFELRGDTSLVVSVPETGQSGTCSLEPPYLLIGWFESNGQATDVAQFNGYQAYPEKACDGLMVRGPFFEAELRLSASGKVVMTHSKRERFTPQVGINGCEYSGKLRSVATVERPLTITFHGAMNSHEPGCPLVADIEAGPFEGFYDSYRVEGRVTP